MEVQKILKIKSIISTIIYFLVVGFLLLYIGFEIALPDKTAKVMQVKAINVVTESMKPKLKYYDAIIISNYKKENLKIGDIITFKQSLPTYDAQTDTYGSRLEYVTHRITNIDIDENGKYTFETKGDANIVVDTWTVDEKNVIGKYLFKIPKGGYVIAFFQSWIGLLIIGFNAAVIMLIIYILSKKETLPSEEEIKKQIKELEAQLEEKKEK